MRKPAVVSVLLAFALSCGAADSFRVKDVQVSVARRKSDVVASAEKELKKHLALVGGWQTSGNGVEIVLGKGPEGSPPATNFESHVVYSGGKIYCWATTGATTGRRVPALSSPFIAFWTRCSALSG